MLRCSVILALVALLGCSNPPLSPVYDTCYDINDCVETATLCEELGVDFGGFTYTNSICTLPCETEGALSPDCPRAWVGRFGSCYPSNVAGGIDDTLICFEPCNSDKSCQEGFVCLGAIDLCGSDPTCPIDENDAICVPGPY
jgi:hypothetical protein